MKNLYEILNNLKTDKTDGEKYYCLINEDYLNAIKELSKREYQEKENLIKFLENEKVRLKRECSLIYTDSLGKTKLLSEDIYNAVNKILEKVRLGKYE